MRSAALAAGLLVAAASAQAAGRADWTRALSGMAAHHATYRLTLDGPPNNRVVAATGTMDYEVLDSCDGWATEQRLMMDVTDIDGRTARMASVYSTWEAKNGSKLRFHVRQTTNDQVTSELAGIADDGPSGGDIHYTEPTAKTLKLAAGTLFPMAHTAHIVALAGAGEKYFPLPLFDGSSDAGAEDTFVVVTNVADARPNRFSTLAALPSDKVNISFFDHGSNGEEPDYAVSMRYWVNGVADDLRMNFGDFSMDGTMVSFKPGAHPC